MKKEFFDFDKLFEEYMRAKFRGKKDIDPEQIKANMSKYYQEWSDKPLAILGGKCPKQYYDDIDEPSLLIDFLVKSCEHDLRPNSYLLDRIRDKGECAKYLYELMDKDINPTLAITIIELLDLMQAPHPLQRYVQILLDLSKSQSYEEEVLAYEPQEDIDLREQIIEVLAQNANEVRESLFAGIEDASQELKTILAEILINADKDERTYNLLTELFVETDNIPLISMYIGRYGDERLAALLYKALDTSSYIEFLEIKNAIERMGGIVDQEPPTHPQD